MLEEVKEKEDMMEYVTAVVPKFFDTAKELEWIESRFWMWYIVNAGQKKHYEQFLRARCNMTSAANFEDWAFVMDTS
jgi:hypothetical protein